MTFPLALALYDPSTLVGYPVIHPFNPICPLHPIKSPVEETHRFTHIKRFQLKFRNDRLIWQKKHASPFLTSSGSLLPCFKVSGYPASRAPRIDCSSWTSQPQWMFFWYSKIMSTSFFHLRCLFSPKKTRKPVIYCYIFSIWMLIPLDNFSASRLRWCRRDVGRLGKRSTDSVSQVLTLFVRLLSAQPGD